MDDWGVHVMLILVYFDYHQKVVRDTYTEMGQADSVNSTQRWSSCCKQFLLFFMIRSGEVCWSVE